MLLMLNINFTTVRYAAMLGSHINEKTPGRCARREFFYRI
jgi:hypothetical protein